MLLGLDVGGTHTDAVLINGSGIVSTAKVVTNHNNLLESINAGIEKVISGVDVNSINRINLSTTLSTNAIVENKIDRVGVMVSAGPGIKADYYKIGNDFFTVTGSLDHRGNETLKLDREQIESACDSFRESGIDVFAVVSKFSTRNPQHENMLMEALDGASFVTVGHMLSGRLNFPRRIATAYYNSAVWKRYEQFADAIQKSVKGLGIDAALNILKADGGTMPLDLSRKMPVETILSGPAASVMGIIALCNIETDSVILDIGGTTTDIAIFASGAPLIEPDGIPINSKLTLVRALKTRSIGIGGDSEVHVKDGEVLVGPERKGPPIADGGNIPTLTDIFNYDKIIEYGNISASMDGVNKLAGENNISPDDLVNSAINYALLTLKSAIDNLVEEINEKPVYTVHELLEGETVKPDTMYIMGGPAHAFSGLLKKRLDIDSIVPDNYAVANAIGAALARTTLYVELHADTERGTMVIPEINYTCSISGSYSLEDAESEAKMNLLSYMRENQVVDKHINAEITESSSFNMVHGFLTTGKNIRVRCQVKPGIIHEYRDLLKKL